VDRTESFTGARTRKEKDKRKRQKKKIAVQGEKIKVVQGFAAMGAQVLSKRSDVIRNISVR
jgi:hypothetical protein